MLRGRHGAPQVGVISIMLLLLVRLLVLLALPCLDSIITQQTAVTKHSSWLAISAVTTRSGPGY
jgi:hypothetical protein